MEVDTQTKQAYSEIDEFLSLLDEKTRNEVPTKLRELFKKEKDKNYHKEINTIIPIKEQNLKKETLALIALLNLQYWCKDEKEKERLKQVYANNENKYQDELRQKYNPDNIFKNSNQSTQKDTEEQREKIIRVQQQERIRIEKEKQEKYKSNELFNNKKEKETQEVALVEVKELKWYKKIFDFFKKILKK